MINLSQILASRQLAARVQRWHTWPMIRRPTNGEHVARTATIYCEIWGIPRGEVLYYILHHDSGEFFAGDSPYFAKRFSPELAIAINKVEEEGLLRLKVKLPKLTDVEFTRFKICDLLEMWETSIAEITMGNRFLEEAEATCRAKAQQLANQLGTQSGSVVSDWLMG